MRNRKTNFGRLLAVILLISISAALAACQATPTATISPTATAVPAKATSAPTGSASAENATVTSTPSVTPTPIVLEGAKTTASGLQYLEEVAGTGAAPKVGDIITMQYIFTLPDGTELANTYTNNQPATTVWGTKRMLPGWEEGVGLMKAGGKAKLVLPPDLAFGAAGSGIVPANSPVLVEVELLSVKNPPNPTAVTEDQLTKTTTGLQYYDITKGDGAEAAKNSNVTTSYTVWVKTDTGYSYIDQSSEGSPVNFVVGRGDVVFPGWEEGVTGMKVGGKRLLVIPPALGMGAQGNSLIPPDATMVMEVNLLDAKEPRVATKVDEKDYTTTASGLKYYDLTPGTGATPAPGQTVTVHYTGWLENGTQFDSSVDRGEPFSFQIGKGNVIPGWDEGVSTMKVGGKRQLMIPPALGYGDQGAGSVIPPNATLIFEVELLSVK